jgi:hypothetical protein
MVNVSNLCISVYILFAYNQPFFFSLSGSDIEPAECGNRYRERQLNFLKKCMAHFKTENKTWVLLTDVDEYISSDALDWGEDGNANVQNVKNNTFSSNKHKTIEDILKSQEIEVSPCLPFTRHLYSSKEETKDYEFMAPLGFHDEDFVTLRYRWRAKKDKIFVNRWQKTIIDVSRISEQDIAGGGVSIHAPLYNWCPAETKVYRPTLLRAVSTYVFVMV